MQLDRVTPTSNFNIHLVSFLGGGGGGGGVKLRLSLTTPDNFPLVIARITNKNSL